MLNDKAKVVSSSKLSNTNYVNIFAHPDAFLRRWEVMPDGKRAKCPILDELRIQESGAQIHKATGITILPSKESPLLLITGEIPRETSFEKGYPFQYVENKEEDDENNEKNLVPDPMVKDDQAIVASIRDKGLVILTGCGHAGIINTINYAKRITGVDRVYAVIGGFHLPADGGIYEAAIESNYISSKKQIPNT